MAGQEAYHLTAAQLDQFHKDGFLVLPNHASAEDIAKLRQRAQELVDGFDPETISVFSTRNQSQTTDDYFLRSSGTVGFFFEERSFDKDRNLVQPKSLCINKIGHALHDLDPVFREFSRSPKVSGLVKSLGMRRPLPVQSMYIFKQPKIGGEVVPHQDSSFLYTEPTSCVGLWWALEDADRHNGCLWALPAVHKEGLKRRFIHTSAGMTFDQPAPEYDLSQFVPVEVAAGTLVLLHGENVHYSAENTSSVSRHAYSIHLVEGDGGHAWAADNWAQRPADQPWEPLYDDTTAAPAS